MKIYKRIVKCKSGDRQYWVLDLGKKDVGRRERRTFLSYQEARAHAADFKHQKKRYGQVLLTPGQYNMAVEAYDLLAENALIDPDILLAIREYVENHHRKFNRVILKDAIADYIRKYDADQELQRKAVGSRLGFLVTVIGEAAPIDAITENDIDAVVEYMEKHGFAPKTINNVINYASSFFIWCIKRNHCAENPVKAERRRERYTDPKFIKPEDLENILRIVCNMGGRYTEVLMPFFILSFFCGIRSSEILRLSNSCVCIDDDVPFVRISTVKGAGNGRRGRTVDLEANAIAWLRKYPVPESFNANEINALRTALRRSLPDELREALSPNVGRHSYITYHIAKYRDCPRTEAFVGTSSAMRIAHYQGLASSEDGRKFFDINP